MKIKSLIYTALASVVLFTSCDLNKQPTFNDETQAFIAFDSASGMLDELDGTAEISLYCASLAGINASAEIAFNADAYADNAAAVGTHFNVAYAVRYSIDFDNQSPTFNERINVDTIAFTAAPYVINFDNKHQFATVVLEAVDNDAREPNKKFDVQLANIQGCNKGAMNTYSVTILDDENPFNRLLGEYTATGESAAQEKTMEWDVTLTADDEVENKLWIQPVISTTQFGLGHDRVAAVEATVDDVQGTISMRIGQSIYAVEGQMDLIICGITNNIETTGIGVANYDVEGDVTITWSSALGAYDAVGAALYEYFTNIVYTKK